MSKKKVEEQKGPIIADQKTSKQMGHIEKLVEKARDLSILIDNQSLKLHEPKK